MVDKIKLFEQKQIRTHWDEESEELHFSVVDVCNVLSESESKDPGAYWRKLKQRLIAEGSEVVTNCHGLKLQASDGKYMLAEVSTTAISKSREPKTFDENRSIANEGGKIAENARRNLETQIGQSVISPLNASDKPSLEIEAGHKIEDNQASF